MKGFRSVNVWQDSFKLQQVLIYDRVAEVSHIKVPEKVFRLPVLLEETYKHPQSTDLLDQIKLLSEKVLEL